MRHTDCTHQIEITPGLVGTVHSHTVIEAAALDAAMEKASRSLEDFRWDDAVRHTFIRKQAQKMVHFQHKEIPLAFLI